MRPSFQASRWSSPLAILADDHRSVWTALATSAVLIVVLFSVLAFSYAVAGAVFTVAAVWLSVIDLRVRLLPDVLTLPLAAAGIAVAALGFGPDFFNAMLGAGLGYGSIALVAYFYRMRRGVQGIGMGDAKFLAGIGAWTGADYLPAVVLAAALAGLTGHLVSTRGLRFEPGAAVPFGPFLAAAGWLALLHLHATAVQVV